MPFLASEECFWPPTASMTSEVKINYAYVITQDICNKFIEVNFCVGCTHGLMAKSNVQTLNILGLLIRLVGKSLYVISLHLVEIGLSFLPNLGGKKSPCP